MTTQVLPNLKAVDSKLEQLLDKTKQKSRIASQIHIQQEISSIYKQIINGDIQIAQQKKQVEKKQFKNNIQQILRKKLIKQAQKQKIQLQQKLGYLNNSLNVMKKYELRSSSVGGVTPRQSYTTENTRVKDQQFKRNKKLWKDQIEGQKKKQLQKRKKQQQQLKQSALRTQSERNQSKKKQIIDHMKQIQQRMARRDLQVKQGNQRYMKAIKQKSMFQKMNESYQQKEISFLQEQKKKLAQIRSLKRPIDQKQIKNHEQKFMQLKRQKQQERTKDKKIHNSKADKQMYQSSFYRKIVESEKSNEENQCVIKYKKMKQFLTHVKEHFVPQVDEKRRQQILDYIQKQKRKSQQKQQKQKESNQKPRQLGLEYLSSLRDIPKKKKDQSRISTPQTERVIYKNYLTHHLSSNSSTKQQAWKKILSSSADKEQKAIKIKIQSQKKQVQLKRKQQQSRLIGQVDPNQIDDEYFSMIKAKLDFLADK